MDVSIHLGGEWGPRFARETAPSGIEKTVDLLYQIQKALGVLFHRRLGAQGDPAFSARGSGPRRRVTMRRQRLVARMYPR